MCLARTLLKQSKIVILDEATSSVDEETDRRVMAAYKTQFINRTVLIIAHRIRTIIDCDKYKLYIYQLFVFVCIQNFNIRKWICR